jgi:uncharacterized membrane protein
LTDSGYKAIKKRNLSRWGIAAVPLGLLLGLVVGISFGNAAIGVAIGAALGFGAAVSLLAAVVVFRSAEKPE